MLIDWLVIAERFEVRGHGTNYITLTFRSIGIGGCAVPLPMQGSQCQFQKAATWFHIIYSYFILCIQDLREAIFAAITELVLQNASSVRHNVPVLLRRFLIHNKRWGSYKVMAADSGLVTVFAKNLIKELQQPSLDRKVGLTFLGVPCK